MRFFRWATWAPSFFDHFCEESAVVIELSKGEQGKVVGGWGPAGAIFGATVSTWAYLGYASTSGVFSWQQLSRDVVLGAAGGFIAGPASSAARAFLAPRVVGTIGAIYGAGDPRSKFMN